MDTAVLLARLLLAAVFAVAGAAKLADLAGSRVAVANFGVPERLAGPVGTILPIAELATAVALLPTATARAGAVSALVLLLLFSAGIAVSIARGEAPDCHCFGQLHSSPAGPATLVRNLSLAAVAAFAAFAAAAPGESIGGALSSLSGTALVVIAALAALSAAGALAAFFYLQLLRQHGRLMIRVEALEDALRARGIPIPEAESAEPDRGLPVGAPAPEFNLPGLHGETVTLASLRAAGRPVLLFFTDPACAPCRALLPRVGQWREEHAKRLTIAVISRGDAEKIAAEAAEHGVAPVLAEGARTVSDPYQARATPSAVLVDSGGRVAARLASGEPEIVALVESAARDPLDVVRVPAAPPSAIGNPLPPGPELETLDGETTSLASEIEDAERVVVLWDPACGFCQRMLPDLRRFEIDGGEEAGSLVLVSRGDPEENRAQGLVSPILLDEGFRVGRALGAGGTPSAIRIGRDGRIASEVAVGADAVLALARARTEA